MLKYLMFGNRVGFVEYVTRLRSCGLCGSFDEETWKCKTCGCYVDKKCKMSTEHCPTDRW